jgi:hypothetical protein
MLDALSGNCPQRHLQPFRGVSDLAKALQRTLGDLGDLERLHDWMTSSPDGGARGKHWNYRKERTRVLADAAKAHRKLARIAPG